MNERIPLCSGTYLENGVVDFDWFLIIGFLIGNLIVAVSYFWIPRLIFDVIRNRTDVKGAVKETFIHFIVFILLCGTGHVFKAVGTLHSANNFMELGTGYYYFEMFLDLITGLFSAFTVFRLIKIVPNLIKLPTLQDAAISVHVQNVTKTGYWVWDIAANTVTWSDGVYAIYGLEKESDIIDVEQLDKMVDPADLQDQYENRKRFAFGDYEKNISYWITTPQGERKFLTCILHMEYDGGNLVRAFGTVTDETARRSKEMNREKTLAEIKNEVALLRTTAANGGRLDEIDTLLQKL